MKKTRVIMSLILILTLLGGITVYGNSEAGKVNSAGWGSTYVVRQDGSLWAWGSGTIGNGNASDDNQYEPVKILDNVRSVSGGESRTAVAVKKDDTLWGWGSFDGYPGGPEESDPDYLVPTQFDIDDVKMAAAGHRYVLALKNDNTLWVCGYMTAGDGTIEKAEEKEGFVKVADNVINMHSGDGTVYLIKDDFTLWGYGDNSDAQLGNMTNQGETGTEAILTLTHILDDVIHVHSDNDVVLAIRRDNTLYGWGDSGFYTEENGWVEEAGKPYLITSNVKDCVVRGDNAFIIKTDNTLWGWGYSYQGNSVGDETVLRHIADNVLSVTTGERHASIVKTDYTLWTMGGNYRGGLGYDSEEVWYTPLTQILDNVQDSPATWAAAEVEKAIGAKLIPDDLQNDYYAPITREEFCILAIQMIEVKFDMTIDEYMEDLGLEREAAGTFTDCDNPDVMAAKALGITQGTSETTFEPDNLLTREQAAKFLTTTAIACGREVELSTPDYADVSEIASWATPYTGYVFDIGVMKGVGSNRFAPKDSYQRQQAFMTMYRIWVALDSDE